MAGWAPKGAVMRGMWRPLGIHFVPLPAHAVSPRRPENCSAGGGGGVTWTPAEGGGGGLEKWGSVSGPLFCVRTDVGAEGAGTQILARKNFFH